jgi:cellobiose-specific phosphotransferase system component IIB
MVKDAKAAARNIGDTKLLAASIGSVVKVYRQQTAFLAIGPRTKFKSKKREKLLGKKANRDPVKYAHLIEFGVQPHTIEGNPFLYIPDYAGGIMRVRSVDHPGFKARPFLRPAFDKHKNGALRAMAAEVALGIRRETRGAK